MIVVMNSSMACSRMIEPPAGPSSAAFSVSASAPAKSDAVSDCSNFGNSSSLRYASTMRVRRVPTAVRAVFHAARLRSPSAAERSGCGRSLHDLDRAARAISLRRRAARAPPWAASVSRRWRRLLRRLGLHGLCGTGCHRIRSGRESEEESGSQPTAGAHAWGRTDSTSCLQALT